MKLSSRYAPGVPVWALYFRKWNAGIVEKVGRRNLTVHLRDKGLLADIPATRIRFRNPRLADADIPVTA